MSSPNATTLGRELSRELVVQPHHPWLCSWVCSSPQRCRQNAVVSTRRRPLIPPVLRCRLGYLIPLCASCLSLCDICGVLRWSASFLLLRRLPARWERSVLRETGGESLRPEVLVHLASKGPLCSNLYVVILLRPIGSNCTVLFWTSSTPALARSKMYIQSASK